jgi:hypothetical protein
MNTDEDLINGPKTVFFDVVLPQQGFFAAHGLQNLHTVHMYSEVSLVLDCCLQHAQFVPLEALTMLCVDWAITVAGFVH